MSAPLSWPMVAALEILGMAGEPCVTSNRNAAGTVNGTSAQALIDRGLAENVETSHRRGIYVRITAGGRAVLATLDAVRKAGR